MDDFVYNNLGRFVAGALLLIFIGFAAAVSSENEQKAEFMKECRQDHKQYECTAMWRAGRARR